MWKKNNLIIVICLTNEANIWKCEMNGMIFSLLLDFYKSEKKIEVKFLWKLSLVIGIAVLHSGHLITILVYVGGFVNSFT